MNKETPPEALALAPPSRWGAFAHLAFAIIWAASTVSNFGIAMFDAATGWFMANMSPDPTVVSLIQVATSLPLFLFTIPAGALADLVCPKALLLNVSVAVLVVATAFAGAVSLGWATPSLLLGSLSLAELAGVVNDALAAAVVVVVAECE